MSWLRWWRKRDEWVFRCWNGCGFEAWGADVDAIVRLAKEHKASCPRKAAP